MIISRGKDIALNKQLEFKERLGFTASGEHNVKRYKHILSNEDALKGANFYCYDDIVEWESLQKWAINDKRKLNFASNGLKNMLRSEHIPYNIFYPFEKLRKNNPELLCKLLGEILKCDIEKVNEIRVEYAGNVDKSELLNDNTSFDAYIGFQSGGESCGAGFELKYTEGSYPYGKSELENLNNESSLYWETAKASNMFILSGENKKQLISKNLKQFWRNHLLGTKMIQNNMLKKFYSVHFFPNQNTYQQFYAQQYLNTIKDSCKQYFILFSFEDFLEACSKVGINDKWLTYFKNRYC